MLQFPGQLRVTEQESQRGAKVVELSGRYARGFGIAGGVADGRFPVEQEQLARGGVVSPAHTPGFAQGQGTRLRPVLAHAWVAFGVAGLERAQVVVMSVDHFGQRIRGGGLRLARGLGSTRERKAQDKQEQGKFHKRNLVTGDLECGSTCAVLRSGRDPALILKFEPAGEFWLSAAGSMLLSEEWASFALQEELIAEVPCSWSRPLGRSGSAHFHRCSSRDLRSGPPSWAQP